jgi:hypothetical protein
MSSFETGLRTRLTQVEARLDGIDARLRAEFPDYFALIRPTPLDIAAAQRLLGPDEALLLAVPSAFGTHVVALTSDRVAWVRSGWNTARVNATVQRLRWDLGANVTVPEARRRRWEAEAQAAGRTVFRTRRSLCLHQELIAPVAPLLAGKRRLFVAAGGALAGLPFSVLVAAPPRGADNDPASLRVTQWLGDRHDLIHIPSIQSLALLRQGGAPARVEGGGDFIGFGGSNAQWPGHVSRPARRAVSAACVANIPAQPVPRRHRHGRYFRTAGDGESAGTARRARGSPCGARRPPGVSAPRRASPPSRPCGPPTSRVCDCSSSPPTV